MNGFWNQSMRAVVGFGILLAASNARAADETALFNGKNFSGWTFFLEQKGYNAGEKARSLISRA